LAEDVADIAGVADVFTRSADTNDITGGGDVIPSIGAESDIAAASAAECQRQITDGCIVVAGGAVD
jgi:hypothetical protein